VPLAATENVTVCPAVTVALDGWLLIVGATAAAYCTVKVAPFEVTAPALLVTTTVNTAPLSPLTVAGVV